MNPYRRFVRWLARADLRGLEQANATLSTEAGQTCANIVRWQHEQQEHVNVAWHSGHAVGERVGIQRAFAAVQDQINERAALLPELVAAEQADLDAAQKRVLH